MVKPQFHNSILSVNLLRIYHLPSTEPGTQDETSKKTPSRTSESLQYNRAETTPIMEGQNYKNNRAPELRVWEGIWEEMTTD